jgi:hypothetical protein
MRTNNFNLKLLYAVIVGLSVMINLIVYLGIIPNYYDGYASYWPVLSVFAVSAIALFWLSTGFHSSLSAKIFHIAFAEIFIFCLSMLIIVKIRGS